MAFSMMPDKGKRGTDQKKQLEAPRRSKKDDVLNSSRRGGKKRGSEKAGDECYQRGQHRRGKGKGALRGEVVDREKKRVELEREHYTSSGKKEGPLCLDPRGKGRLGGSISHEKLSLVESQDQLCLERGRE